MFEVERDGDVLTVTAPRYREDIEVGEPDLAEEVIREYGYEHIVPTFLKDSAVTNGGLNPAQKRRTKLKQVMVSRAISRYPLWHSTPTLTSMRFMSLRTRRSAM